MDIIHISDDMSLLRHHTDRISDKIIVWFYNTVLDIK